VTWDRAVTLENLMTRPSYLDRLQEKVIVFDGATGSNLQMCNLTADDFGGPDLEGCNEVLVATRPDVMAQLHASFFEVGVDVVETDTFGGFANVLAEYGLADRAHELNVQAATIARQVADDYSTCGHHRYVAGSMGRFAELRDQYQVQADGLLTGGVDLLIIETCFDLLQAKAAVIGSRRAMAHQGRRVPIQLQVTMETTGRMLLGSEIGAAMTSLVAMKPDVFGLNCATGPAEMSEHLRYLSQNCPIPISVLPNAGLPSVVDGKMHYDLTPEQLGEFHRHHVVDLGIGVVGGCCGTSPEHLRHVVNAVGSMEPPRRSPVYEPSVSSIYSPVTMV
jgi:5-methyltetrahydrofolate--homocysteine methyltransferase